MNILTSVPSPAGLLTLAAEGDALTGLWFVGQKYYAATLTQPLEDAHLPVFDAAQAWLEAYFAGEYPEIAFPLAPKGSPFRQAVWALLREIPYGSHVTYGFLAQQLRAKTGQSVCAQAVGGAVGHNPISILIPCHRVVGAKGQLTGYAAGLAVKEQLLALENKSAH